MNPNAEAPRQNPSTRFLPAKSVFHLLLMKPLQFGRLEIRYSSIGQMMRGVQINRAIFAQSHLQHTISTCEKVKLFESKEMAKLCPTATALAPIIKHFIKRERVCFLCLAHPPSVIAPLDWLHPPTPRLYHAASATACQSFLPPARDPAGAATTSKKPWLPRSFRNGSPF